MTEYVSSIKAITASQAVVYDKLSDLSGISIVNEALQHAPEGKSITIEAIDRDSCAFVIAGAGRLILKITDREPHKTIKLEAIDAPLPLTIWIQLVSAGAYDTRLRLTLRTELNFIMRKMIGGKLEEGVERLADMLAMFPYS